MWIYPLRDPNDEQQLSLKLDVPAEDQGSLSANYLCLTITLERPQNDKRVLTLAPYNTRHLFNFKFPMLTLWKSYTSKPVKLAALKGMVQYAILGSNDPDETVRFLCSIIDRLKTNGYPQQSVKEMWRDVESDHLYSTPCRVYLHSNLITVAERVTQHIHNAFSNS